MPNSRYIKRFLKYFSLFLLFPCNNQKFQDNTAKNCLPNPSKFHILQYLFITSNV